MMYMFDVDRSGQIEFYEFNMILEQLGGLKKYDKQSIKDKKGKHKGKDKGKNKDKGKDKHKKKKSKGNDILGDVLKQLF